MHSSGKRNRKAVPIQVSGTGISKQEAMAPVLKHATEHNSATCFRSMLLNSVQYYIRFLGRKSKQGFVSRRDKYCFDFEHDR